MKLYHIHLSSFSFLSDNIISLDIYFQDMSYDEIEQTPVFKAWSLIGRSRWCEIQDQNVF